MSSTVKALELSRLWLVNAREVIESLTDERSTQGPAGYALKAIPGTLALIDAELARLRAGGREDAAPVERGSEAWRRLRIAVMSADERFEAAGDAGTKTWLEEYLLPELTAVGLYVVMAETAPPRTP